MNDLERAIQLREAGQLEEAKTILLELIKREPMNPSVWYQCAWVHDAMELEREAVPYYQRSLELELQDEERQGAYLGLGSTLRTLGMYEGIQEYKKAILFYSDKLNKIWD